MKDTRMREVSPYFPCRIHSTEDALRAPRRVSR
jgi:hypothetical protein